MSKPYCPECGYPLKGNESLCPECGYSFQRTENPTSLRQNNYNESSISYDNQIVSNENYKTFSQLFWGCEFYKLFKGKHFDLGQRTYEFGTFIWEIVVSSWNTMWNKFGNFSGRASRRELWSYWWGLPFLGLFSFGILFIIGLIPLIAVCIRRMHDTNHSGWWVLVPVASFFLSLKKSDDHPNRYGNL